MENAIKIDRSTLIKWAITVVMVAVCLLIPDISFYEGKVKAFLAITVFGLALAGFELCPNFIIAIIMPALWIFCKVAPASTVMAAWTTTTPLLVCGGLFLAATLEDCGLLRRIAYTIMLFAKGNYFILLLCIMITGIVLNIISSGQGYLILGALGAGLYLSMPEKDPKFGVGIATAVLLGGCQSHAYTYQAAAWGAILPLAAEYVPANAVTPLSIILHCWPLFLVGVVTLFLVSKWYQPEIRLDNITYFKDELEKMGKITLFERNNIIMLVILLVLIFTVDFTGLDVNLIFGIVPFLVYLPFMKGATQKTLSVKMNFEMIFFVMSFMSIGTVAGALGLGAYIAQAINFVLAGSTSPFVIFAVIFCIVFLLNFLMTPLAIFALITAPVCAIAMHAGFDPAVFLYAVNACSEAILMPYEYVPYLIVYSFGMIGMADFIKTNALRSILFLLGFLGILIPYWMLIGLI